MIFLELKSPNSDEIANFSWKHSSLTAHEGNNEILQVIRYICQDIADDRFRNFIAQNVEPTTFNDFEKMKNVCKAFNELVDHVVVNKEYTRPEHSYKPLAPPDLLKFVMHITYNRAVVEPEKLNQYEPFSPQVYGETSFDLIEQMLKKTTLNEPDLFMDLGSGVGNVVLQVAGSVRCKLCFGVEKAEWPAFYAVRMENEFRFWMGFFGKYFSRFKIYKGDFLSEEQMIEAEESTAHSSTTIKSISMGEYVKELINEANLVFVNNYAFGATVDHELKMRFCNMQEGSLIVSSKPFCSLTFRINSRNLNDIGTILNTHDIEPVCGHVSWTDKPISYYFQRIDRTQLERYFERLKNPTRFKDENDSSNHNDSIGSHSSAYASSSASTSPASSPNSIASSSRSSNDARKSKSSKPRSSNNKSNTSSHSPSPGSKTKSTKENRKRKSVSRVDSANSDCVKPTLTSEDPNPMKKSKINGQGAKNNEKSSNIKADAINKMLSKMHDQSRELVRANNKNQSDSEFNINGLTRMSRDNCDVNALNDCKVLTKYSANIYTELSEKNLNAKPKSAPVQVANGETSVDLEPFNRQVIDDNSDAEFGDDIIHALDHYLRKCRGQYIKYLKSLMSDSCKEKLKTKLVDQAERNRQLLVKISTREEQIKSLTSSGIRLIKTKASELGLKNVKTPNDLVEYARALVADNHSLLNRIKGLQETVNHLENKLSRLGGNGGAPKNLLNGVTSTNVLDGLTIDGTLLLDKILSQMNKDSSTVKGHLPDLLKCRDKDRPLSQPTSASKTGGEPDGDEDSQASGSSSDKTSNRSVHHGNMSQGKHHGEKVKTRIKTEHVDDMKVVTPNRKPNPASLNGKSILEQIFCSSSSLSSASLADSKLESLRNFKIPRTTTSPIHNESGKKCKSPSTPPDSPSSMSSASSSSSSSIAKASTGLQTKESSSSSLSRQTSLSSSSDSNFAQNYKTTDTTTQTPCNAAASTTAYYHPKKSQFRQYLMESSTTTTTAPGAEASVAPNGLEPTEPRRPTRWSPVETPPAPEHHARISPTKQALTFQNKFSASVSGAIQQHLPQIPSYFQHDQNQYQQFVSPPPIHADGAQIYHGPDSDYTLVNQFSHRSFNSNAQLPSFQQHFQQQQQQLPKHHNKK